MLQDAADIPRDTVLRADVVVIGGGAAGIALARAFAGSATSVLVLESGGLEADDATTELMHAINTHEDYPVDFARLRYFGGTTNHWGGWCRAIDPWAMARRPWVSELGWPITFDDLDPYYPAAAAVVELPTYPDGWRWDWSYWLTQLPGLGLRPLLENDVVTGAMFRFSPPTRFGTKYRAELEQAENVRVVLHANALRVDTDRDGRRVTEVPVASLKGNRFTAVGRAVVVAVGGLDVPRLLLLSNRTRPKGLGNEHDLVGRYFMDHIEGSVGTLDLARDDVALYLGGLVANQRAMVLLRPEVMQREELPGCALSIDTDTAGVAKYADARTGISARRVGTLRRGFYSGESHTFDVVVRCEPKPTASSRVVLSGQRDALGQRRLELQYARAAADTDTIRRTMRIMAREFAGNGLGRLRIDLEDTPKTSSEIPTLGFHLMGTTRMADDPRRGVVDPDLKVHGVDNLFIASSSVFPTAGISNPTLTLMALTLRLKDRLVSKVLV